MLSERLKYLRREKKLSQAALAEAIGVQSVRMPGGQRISVVEGQKKHGESPICRTTDCSSTKAVQRQRDFEESLSINSFKKRQKSIVRIQLCILCIKMHS